MVNSFFPSKLFLDVNKSDPLIINSNLFYFDMKANVPKTQPIHSSNESAKIMTNIQKARIEFWHYDYPYRFGRILKKMSFGNLIGVKSGNNSILFYNHVNFRIETKFKIEGLKVIEIY